MMMGQFQSGSGSGVAGSWRGSGSHCYRLMVHMTASDGIGALAQVADRGLRRAPASSQYGCDAQVKGAAAVRYLHVDVFSRYPYRGNGLTVFPDGAELGGAQMLSITREMRQFESIFLFAGAAPDGIRARIFTADEELDFAGHPVLGAAAAVHHLGAADQTAIWDIELNRGSVEVETRRCGDWYEATMEQGVARFGPPLTAEQALTITSALGLASSDVRSDVPIQMVSTGLAYIIVPVGSGLERCAINHRRFEELLASVGAKFVYVLDPEAREGRTWDNAGRVEDIATGSAAGPAGAYLAAHGIADSDTEIVINQGRFVGRPSQMRVRVHRDADSDWHASVTGDVTPVGDGVLRRLPE
jgi:trans-2,3-dihydro-3-hydroxyanthranilate isomerase